ncbi:YgaP-like transmembrane domain [Lysinibacillus sp. 54212]|uniref:YgaP-like transmembrane domain n=1 Tax=Lysinibacillus sp. 54212 TaxID=3119829 RepID=UPI002FC83733
MLEDNISEKNAFIRLICGVSMVSFGTARIVNDSSCMIGKAMIVAGAMKVAEGMYQYCPLVALMDKKDPMESMMD